jgi:hypothetical protein
VRECGNVLQGPAADLACTQWSNFLTLKTGAQGGDQVTFYLDGVLPSIGSAPVAADGTFQAPATIPTMAKPGTHELDAVISSVDPQGSKINEIAPALNGLQGEANPGGSLLVDPNLANGHNAIGHPDASTMIVVGDAGQSLPPVIGVVDPSNNNANLSQVYEEQHFTVQGDSFAPGPVAIYLDSAGSKVSWTATAAQGDPLHNPGSFTATFTMPDGANGGDYHHSLVAVQTVNGKTVQATVPLNVLAKPR